MLADFQEAAARRAVEVLRRHGGVLLADAPGLGKSWVAATVAARAGMEVDCVVPASLLPQWRETIARFALSARVITHDGLASQPFFPSPEARRLLVVDEAHAFRNPATQRYGALARRSVGAAVLLITATPLCNSAADLEALLRLMVRDDVLAAKGVPSIDLAFATGDRAALETVLSELMIRREAAVVPSDLRFGRLERRVVRHRVPRLPLHELQFPLVGAGALLRRFLERRLESSEAALLESIARQRRFYLRVLESGRPLPKSEYRRSFGREEDAAAFQQVLFWDLWSAPGELDRPAIERELQSLDALRAAAEREPSGKRLLLTDVLGRIDGPVIVFTSAAATARDLARHLRCSVATSRDGRGGLEAFRRGRSPVLVATDLASEGLNLQHAAAVVHYDIPWNPVRLDQRNGRIHRIGQKRSAVRAWYFVPEGDETGIVRAVLAKTRTRRRMVRPRAWRGEAAAPGTLRPRIAASAAILRFSAAAEAAGIDVPEFLERRHRAGMELLLEELSREILDDRRLAMLLALARTEMHWMRFADATGSR